MLQNFGKMVYALLSSLSNLPFMAKNILKVCRSKCFKGDGSGFTGPSWNYINMTLISQNYGAQEGTTFNFSQK